MGGEWWNIPLVVTLIAGAAGAVWAFLNRKGTERFQTTKLMPPTWPEMWQHMKDQDARIDALENTVNLKTNAISNILRALANQWPKNSPAPKLDPKDLEILGDTVPKQWVYSSDLNEGTVE